MKIPSLMMLGVSLATGAFAQSEDVLVDLFKKSQYVVAMTVLENGDYQVTCRYGGDITGVISDALCEVNTVFKGELSAKDKFVVHDSYRVRTVLNFSPKTDEQIEDEKKNPNAYFNGEKLLSKEQPKIKAGGKYIAFLRKRGGPVPFKKDGTDTRRFPQLGFADSHVGVLPYDEFLAKDIEIYKEIK